MRILAWAAFAAAMMVAGSAAAAQPLPFDPDAATRAWLDTMDAASRARSDSYFEGGYWIQFVGPLIGFAVAFLFLQLGWARAMRDGLRKTLKFYVFATFAFALIYSVIGSLVSFPWDYWVGFIRQHDYALSTQNFSQWFSEYLTAFAINLAIGTFSITIFYLILAAAKKTWWIWGSMAAVILAIISISLAPVYIAPLFNTYTSMPDGPLKASVLHMAQANGVPATDVQVYDRSRQTNSVSANVSGFGETTHISLADTLIQRETPGGVRAVLGHEIGHYVLRHNVSILLMFAMLIVVVFALTHILFTRISAGERWDIKHIADPAGMPLLFSIIGFLFLLATPIQNNIIRYHESQADYFGINASREPDGWAQSALLLSEYRKMEPTPLEEWFFYDHPSGYTRIHMAMQWKAHEMAAGRYPMGPGGPPPGWRPDFVVTSAGPENAPRPVTPAPAEEPSPAAP